MPSEIITSLQNPRVKRTAKLRERRQRQKQGRFLIDGARELLRALEAGVELEEVFVCEGLLHGEAQEAWRQLNAAGVPAVQVTAAVFERLAFGERAEGLLGVAMSAHKRLEDLRLPEQPLVAVLEAIEKPGNVGAVLRSADAAGVSAVVLADGVTDLYNPNAIRASLGAIFTLPVCAATSSETLAWLQSRGLRIFAAWVDAEPLYTEVDYRGPAALVLGSEAQGLSPVWSGPEVTRVRLPMRGLVDSLNVSAAAAVLFYEALRQRSER